MVSFFPFYPTNSWKKENFKKVKKTPADIIVLHKCYKTHDHMILICSWDMTCDGCNCYFSFWAFFCPFNPPPPPNSQKNENFTKMKKYPGDIIILHKCTKTHDNMMCCSWDMVRGRCNYFSFWATFCPFTPLTAQKIKISLKWKKVLEISSFYASVPKIMIICYIVLEIWHMMYVIVVFHLGNFLHFYPLTAQK